MLRILDVGDRADILDRFATSVQRYYPIKKGSPVSAFEECAKTMPVFELIKDGI
jgi:hypothetical protein